MANEYGRYKELYKAAVVKRRKTMSPEERTARAIKGAMARWGDQCQSF